MLTTINRPVLPTARQYSERTKIAEILLSRYPELSDKDLGKLADTLPYLPPVELSLMLADDHLSTKLEAFHRDHGHLLTAPRTWLLASLVATGAICAAILWWVMSSVPAL